MSELEAAAVREVVAAWVRVGAVSQGALRRQHPVLCSALDMLVQARAEGEEGDGDRKALSSAELHMISERYRTSPWALPPALRRG